MFGREPRLPVDIAFDINKNKSLSLTKYVSSLRERLQKAYDLASKSARAAQQRQKQTYDVRVRGATIQEGDRVLVRIVAYDGRHKIADRWEEDVYIVLDQPTKDIPVFVVQKENGLGKKRTLHRNLLLPIGSLPRPETPVPAPRMKPPSVPKPAPKPRLLKNMEDQSRDFSDVYDDDDAVIYITSELPSAIEPMEVNVPSDVDAGAIGEDVVIAPQELDDDPELSVGEQDSELSGDAHTSTSEENNSDPEPEEDEEETHEDADGVAEEEVEPSNDDSDEDEVPALPRARPRRERRLPPRLASGDYVFTQTVHQPDWIQRVECLKSLVDSGHINGPAAGAFLSIVTGQQIK